MPQPTMPPTPAPSTDIKGREHSGGFQNDAHFNLPPSAMSQKPPQESSSSPLSPTSPKSFFGAPPSPQKKRTASQAALNNTDEVHLPPPPTRSRKIIQVKPKNQDPSPSANQSASASAGANGSKGSGNNGKKKQGAGTSAGRKIARKTAHSLIERRRRSKMNEEFGVLKDMIPACRGQEMHKLAILQASIDYLRYLETCLADVQSGGTRPSSSVASSSLAPQHQRSGITTPSEINTAPPVDSEMDEDDDAPDDAQASVQPSPQHQRSDYYGSTFVSPALSATVTSPPFHAQASSYSMRRPSVSMFEPPSPASARFPADRAYAPYQSRTYAPSPHAQSNQPSPMLLPQSSHSSAPSELDHEASAALLMLNASDRRSSITERKPSVSSKPTSDFKSRQGIKGISVKDLLTN